MVYSLRVGPKDLALVKFHVIKKEKEKEKKKKLEQLEEWVVDPKQQA